MYYHLHLKQPNGQIETSKTELAQTSITIGRGASCDIRPLGLTVALLHAEVYEDGDALFVRDFNSLAGTKVDGKLVTNAVLTEGSQLQIGESTIRISRDGAQWVLTESRAAEGTTNEDEFSGKVAKRMDIRTALPSMTFLSLLLVVPIVMFFFVFPMFTTNQRSWNTGPISNSHQGIADDCRQCHATPFQAVDDSSCKQCHSMSEHSEEVSPAHATNGHAGIRCASCHMEHNGDSGLVVKDSNLCTSCHANLEALVPGTTTAAVASFAEHPEFEISGNVAAPRATKSAPPLDTNPLKFNHEVHLDADLARVSKQDPLTCSSCHMPTDDGRGFQPISMEKNCQSCHSLEFDERLPGLSVPHEDPDSVYRFLYSSYAGLFLDKEGAEELRKFLRDRPGGIKERSQEIAFYRESVKKESRKTEKELFTRLACSVCHVVQEKPETLDEVESMFSITRPTTPSRWMPAAVFDHAAHRSTACTTCHAGAVDSKSTADILLPSIKDCTTCHHDVAGDGKIASSCVLCHSFHDSTPVAPEHQVDQKHSEQSTLPNFGTPKNQNIFDQVARTIARQESIGEAAH